MHGWPSVSIRNNSSTSTIISSIRPSSYRSLSTMFAHSNLHYSLIHQYLVGFFYFAQNINSSLLTIDRFVYIVKPNWVDVSCLLRPPTISMTSEMETPLVESGCVVVCTSWRAQFLCSWVRSRRIYSLKRVANYSFDSYVVSAYVYNEATDSFSLKTRTGAVSQSFFNRFRNTGDRLFVPHTKVCTMKRRLPVFRCLFFI